jgi:hypothetical protein
MHQPGQRWMYHTGSDVLGVLIARASGRPFEAFLGERFRSSGWVRESSRNRLRTLWIFFGRGVGP